jgi:hypothetical protein
MTSCKEAAMKKLEITDLFSLEEYHKKRSEFRARVLEHKRNRRVPVGPNVTLYFEDRLTIQYQIQEMLRIERIFESEAIAEELEAYNPLIPDGTNLKATMMIEFPDPEERRKALQELAGIEDTIYMQIGDLGRATLYADEDLERTTSEKTAAVHFLRFELAPQMRAALRSGAPMKIGIEHSRYRHHAEVPEAVRSALVADLD